MKEDETDFGSFRVSQMPSLNANLGYMSTFLSESLSTHAATGLPKSHVSKPNSPVPKYLVLIQINIRWIRCSSAVFLKTSF